MLVLLVLAIFWLILSPFLGLRPNLAHLVQPKFFLPFLYLGLGASALCFFAWNFAVEALGPVRTSVSAYLIPVVAVAGRRGAKHNVGSTLSRTLPIRSHEADAKPHVMDTSAYVRLLTNNRSSIGVLSGA